MEEKKTFATKCGIFYLINDRSCNVKCNRCKHEFEFGIDWKNLTSEAVVYRTACPHCGLYIQLPREISTLLPKTTFSTDENDSQKITCKCRHTFHFELEDICTDAEYDYIRCPNCENCIWTSPRFLNPIKYTQLNNWKEFWRYLRVTKNIDEKLLLEYLNTLNREELLKITKKLLYFTEQEQYKQTLIMMVKNFGIDIITDDQEIFYRYKKCYEEGFKIPTTNHEDIVKSYWNRHGKAITSMKILNYFSPHHKLGDTSEVIANTIQAIKNAVGEYGIDVIRPILPEGGRLDDGAAIDESESTVYGILCRCVKNSTDKKIANLYIDFIVWLHQHGFESPCYILDAVRYGGESEYMHNYRYDYSKELAIILENPQNAYEILHQKE